jgi:hypothetical protein
MIERYTAMAAAPPPDEARGIGLSFVDRWPAVAIYAGVALMWLIPGRRLERTITGTAAASQDQGQGQE